jgi:hypothetical protein
MNRSPLLPFLPHYIQRVRLSGLRLVVLRGRAFPGCMVALIEYSEGACDFGDLEV